MSPSIRRFSARRLPWLLAPWLAAACAAPPAPSMAPPAPSTALDVAVARPAPVAAPPALLAWPPARRRPLQVEPGGPLAGTVGFSLADQPYFRHNAAYALAAMPVAEALVVLAALDGPLVTAAGGAFDATTDDLGHFTIADAPAGVPVVVDALLANSHRLAALVPPGRTAITVDEASSMVTEMARWQLRPARDPAAPLAPSLPDLSTEAVAALEADTAAVVEASAFAAGDGDVPTIAVLRAGGGAALRNLYVAAFGRAVTTTAVDPGPADRLSDAWRTLLGYRPLALTRVAGNGVRGYNQAEGQEAVRVQLTDPTHAVLDRDGHMYIAQLDGQLLSLVPGAPVDGTRWGLTGTLAPGHLYTIAGVVNSPSQSETYTQLYDEAVVTAGQAPIARDFALHAPSRLQLDEADADATHLLFASGFGRRIFMIPGADTRRFGRDLQAGRLYVVAGVGVVEVEVPTTPAGDGEEAAGVKLGTPTGLAHDPAGNLWLLDADYGALRVVRATDGRIFTLPVAGAALGWGGAQDLRLAPDGGSLYVADTRHHAIWRVPLPDASAIADLTPAAPALAEANATCVLGRPGEAGFLDQSREGIRFPTLYTVARGVPAFTGSGDAGVLLNRPTSIDFDGAGDLLVADAGNHRIRLLRAGAVYTLGGGFTTTSLEGDARICDFPDTAYLNYGAFDGNVLVADRRGSMVRRLWTTRGTEAPPP